jgi:HK97 family phage major capsid protein
MPSRTDELLLERAELAENITNIAESDDFDPTSDDWTRAQARAEQLDRQLDGISKARERSADFDRIRTTFGASPLTPDVDPTADIGDALVRSQAFKNYVRGGATGSHRLMDIPFNLRALLTTASFASVKDRIVAAEPRRQNPLLNALNRQQVSSNSVEVVTYPAAAPLAGVVAEGTLKPEAAMTIAISTVTLETLAHWKEATRQLLEDEARMRDFISSNLIRGVTDKAEAQAAAVITGGTYTAAAGATMAEAVRVGIANVQAAGYNPNGILINPIDAAKLDINVWTVSTGAPSLTGSIWGVPLIPVGAVAAGSAYVGDFDAAVDFLYRSGVQLYVTDSDVNAVDFSSNFKKNIITFLAEMRAKAVVTRPEAISKATPSGGLVEDAGSQSIEQRDALGGWDRHR